MSQRPVTLPPGRARLATNPCSTGSALTPITIGIVSVALRAARIAGVLPATMAATGRATNSAANPGSRSGWSSANRHSTTMF
jgi:hypothetical protein